MEHTRIGRDVFVRLDKGDEIHSSIRSLSDAGISSAAVTSGIGRVRDAVIGYLDSDGIYQKITIEEPMELLSLQGNLCPGPEGPFSHIHVVCSDNDHVVRGGHLFEAKIEVTAEMHLRILESDGNTALERVATDTEFFSLSFCKLGEI